MHESSLGGRQLIIEENLSPTLIKPRQEARFNVKVFSNQTNDEDIIKYAKQVNSIVLTNNIKDFLKQGITTLKVSERLKAKDQMQNLIKSIKIFLRLPKP